MGEGGRRDAMVGRLARGRDRAGNVDVLPEIPPVIDSGEDPVRLNLEQMSQGHPDAICRSPVHRPIQRPAPIHRQRFVGGDAMPHHGHWSGRSHGVEDSVRKTIRRRPTQSAQSLGLDAVIIAKQNNHLLRLVQPSIRSN